MQSLGHRDILAFSPEELSAVVRDILDQHQDRDDSRLVQRVNKHVQQQLDDSLVQFFHNTSKAAAAAVASASTTSGMKLAPPPVEDLMNECADGIMNLLHSDNNELHRVASMFVNRPLPAHLRFRLWQLLIHGAQTKDKVSIVGSPF